MHKNVEEFYGRKCSPADIFYKKSDITAAYVTGWEEAIEIVKKMPAEELENLFIGDKPVRDIDLEHWVNKNDSYIILPKGSIKKLIGRELTWEDEPVEI